MTNFVNFFSFLFFFLFVPWRKKNSLLQMAAGWSCGNHRSSDNTYGWVFTRLSLQLEHHWEIWSSVRWSPLVRHSPKIIHCFKQGDRKVTMVQFPCIFNSFSTRLCFRRRKKRHSDGTSCCVIVGFHCKLCTSRLAEEIKCTSYFIWLNLYTLDSLKSLKISKFPLKSMPHSSWNCIKP